MRRRMKEEKVDEEAVLRIYVHTVRGLNKGHLLHVF